MINYDRPNVDLDLYGKSNQPIARVQGDQFDGSAPGSRGIRDLDYATSTRRQAAEKAQQRLSGSLLSTRPQPLKQVLRYS
ncbi:hypothetical protein K9N68_37220 (plasmid) [Kovacikia minuta CCNUW1]|uniref:hypothetical protein n=1 Tax=Kovacikia minuta TaxID=2931930 RepID=UPI001CC9B6E0|nr:hypothetical protein [Kovacikia minuta]UBF29854.1 hypothetical protein K9N68_37220 [Kovacikia minuta CCNUW1]